MILSTRAFPSRGSDLAEDRISLTLWPAASLPGNYSFVTNTESLRRLLRRTDLPSTVLEKFETGNYTPKGCEFARGRTSDKTITQNW
jgi:hypothetical protein